MLQKIRLELARDHDFPSGSRDHGYELVAPIDEDGRIAQDNWRAHKDRCRVVRFWGDAEHEIGHLVRKPGGQWAFHYDINGDVEDDETGYRFGDHTFRVGDYVSITEHDDHLRTFRIVHVEDVND